MNFGFGIFLYTQALLMVTVNKEIIEVSNTANKCKETGEYCDNKS